MIPAGRTAASPPRRLAFVTGNAGKVAELRALLPGVDVVQDRRGYPEVQADGLEEVARWGAASLLREGMEPPFVLEDSGLFVDVLGGFPGVYSRHALDTIGCAGLLRLLSGVPAARRSASFQACIAYAGPDRRVELFTGSCPGRIVARQRGRGGFGFDPVFAPLGHRRTFAEMEPAEKSALSHRGAAARALAAHLGPPSKTAKT